MRKFLIKISIALTLAILLHGITLFFFANGKIDPFYLRFTTPKQSSLILGNSRGAQGVQPDVLGTNLANVEVIKPIFNYSFTIGTSPFGPYYLESIKRKLDESTKNGLFILCVDPWSISRDKQFPDDTIYFTEARQIPYDVKNVNIKPNLEYLLKHYHKGWGDMIIINYMMKTKTEVHQNGWLEVTVPMSEEIRKKGIQKKIKNYRNRYFHSKTLSPTRLAYLRETIEFLQQYGSVYLIRIPIDDGLIALEEEYMPDFDSLMEQCAVDLNVPYLNYLKNDSTKYITTDGNHLHKTSAKVFSAKLGKDIARIQKEKTFKANALNKH